MSDSIEKDAEIAAHGHMANCHAHDRRPDGTCYCGFDAALSRLVALAREAEGLREEKSAADRNDSFAAEKLRLVLERWGGKPDETVYGLLERLASERDTAIKAKEAAERVIEAECENKYLLVADLEKAEARIEALTTILTKASAMVEDMPELNTNNYDHDQVCDLNARAVELCLFLRTALEGGTAEVKGG